mmetsp:Transcript_17694/g.36718  ORF Transcript_17694/g.36718 Transcript_17694/m.36718 type:complete len:160 (+) Transcript_17694:140-619(+)
MVEVGYGTIEAGTSVVSDVVGGVAGHGRKVVDDVKGFFLDSDGASQTRTGMKQGVLAAMAYMLGWLSGVILYFVENDNTYVKYHASQSIVVFMGIGAVGWALQTITWITLGWSVFVLKVLNIATIGLWIYLMARAFLGGSTGEIFRLPYADRVADRLAA